MGRVRRKAPHSQGSHVGFFHELKGSAEAWLPGAGVFGTGGDTADSRALSQSRARHPPWRLSRPSLTSWAHRVTFLTSGFLSPKTGVLIQLSIPTCPVILEALRLLSESQL